MIGPPPLNHLFRRAINPWGKEFLVLENLNEFLKREGILFSGQRRGYSSAG
jgi:hypothetical protein